MTAVPFVTFRGDEPQSLPSSFFVPDEAFLEGVEGGVAPSALHFLGLATGLVGTAPSLLGSSSVMCSRFGGMDAGSSSSSGVDSERFGEARRAVHSPRSERLRDGYRLPLDGVGASIGLMRFQSALNTEMFNEIALDFDDASGTRMLPEAMRDHGEDSLSVWPLLISHSNHHTIRSSSMPAVRTKDDKHRESSSTPSPKKEAGAGDSAGSRWTVGRPSDSRSEP